MQSIMDNKLKDELRLQIELTSNCNSTCQGCSRFVSKSDIVNPNIKIGNKGNMTEDVWKSIFDDQRITDKLNFIFNRSLWRLYVTSKSFRIYRLCFKKI